MNSTQKGIIQAADVLSGSIALIATLYCATTLKRQKNGHFTLTDSMLIVVVIIDIVLSTMYIIGTGSYGNLGFCKFQGFMIQWFALAGILWIASTGYQLYKWVVKRKQSESIRKRLKRYAVSCFGISFIFAVALLGADSYGEACTWCWIKGTGTTSEWLRYGCFYFFLMMAWCFNSYMLYRISTAVSGRVTLKDTDGNTKPNELLFTEKIVRNKLRIYLFIFVFTWFFGLLNTTVQFLANKEVFITSLLQAIFVPSQGLLNAIFYGGILREDSELYVWLEVNWTTMHRLLFPRQATEAVRRQSHAAYKKTKEHLAAYEPVKYSIFTTTLNMGEAPFEEMKADLGRWILAGHDVYVVGVQECTELEAVRSAIFAHLGGASQYMMYNAEIGSNNTSLGFHGFIGMMVFLKRSHVLSGCMRVTEASMQTMATGANLLVTTAANKGGVGFPIQIHDASIAFLTAHLPSDSKGVSKLPKRNAAAGALLHEVTLVPNDYGYAAHLQHDHFVFMGDLNYRMETNTSNVSALTGVSIAASLEKEEFGNDSQWLKRRYALLYGESAPEYPSPEEIEIIMRARAAAKGAWGSVLQADELRACLADGVVFHNFQESLPAFPPSYKRKKGAAGDCGDYTDPVDMLNAFSNTGEVELVDEEGGGAAEETPASSTQSVGALEEAAAGAASDPNRDSASSTASKANRRARRQSVVMSLPANATKKQMKAIRPPSYTDRILIHSLPDKRDKLTVLAYDICDELRISDHRAVTAVLHLEVNKRIVAPALTESQCEALLTGSSSGSARMEGPGASSLVPRIPPGKSAFPLQGTTIEFTELVLSDLRIELDAEDPQITNAMGETQNPMVAAAKGSSGSFDIEGGETAPSPKKKAPKRGMGRSMSMFTPGESSADVADTSAVHSITVVFPLPSKDPLVTYRELFDLTQALKVSSKNIIKSLQREAAKAGYGQKFNKEMLLTPAHTLPWDREHREKISIPGCMCPELGAHCLLKVNNAEGDTLGECVIELSHLLSVMQESSERRQIVLTLGGRVTGSLQCRVQLSHLMTHTETAAAGNHSP